MDYYNYHIVKGYLVHDKTGKLCHRILEKDIASNTYKVKPLCKNKPIRIPFYRVTKPRRQTNA